MRRGLIALSALALSLAAGSAAAQAPLPRPDPSGADPHWVRDPATKCLVYTGSPIQGGSVRWSGPCVNGVAEGGGTLVWYAGTRLVSKYVGGVAGGARNGQGVFSYPNGTSLSIAWRDDVADGAGAWRYPDGSELRLTYSRGRAGGAVDYHRPGQVMYAGGLNDVGQLYVGTRLLGPARLVYAPGRQPVIQTPDGQPYPLP